MREIVVFTALRVEMSPLKALLSRSKQVSRKIPILSGQMEGKKVILVWSGVGKERALEAAEFIYSKYSPNGGLSTGFCGGLVPGLRASDVVVSSWVVSDATESGWDSKRLFLGDQVFLLQRVLDGKGIRAHMGGFVCVCRPVVSPNERNALAQRTGAMIAEMETFHLGAFFITRKVPFVGMRTVLDGLEDRIPLLESITEMVEWSDGLNVFWHLISHRGGLSDLWRLYGNGRRAQVALGKSVAAAVRAWP